MTHTILERHPANPIISPQDVTPSRPDFEIISVVNAGVIQTENKTALLLRVAEKFLQSSKETVEVPYITFPDNKAKITKKSFSLADDKYDFSDPRVIQTKKPAHEIIALTSLSHLRLAWSDNGIHFQVEKNPWLFPSTAYEAWGCEDPRITNIEGTYWINYTAVSDLGIATALASTASFQHVERHGIIFPPSNRDVVLFPEKIDGQYAAFHRPMPAYIGGQNIWYTDSPDLLHWGNHKIVASPRSGLWDGEKIGGGAPPLRTQEGWLSVYHGVDKNGHYGLGAMLTDLKEPWKALRRSRQPLLTPEAPYEREGLFPNVCFTCGSLIKNDELWVYYGAADKVLALATMPINQVLQTLETI